jgi:CDP-glucose 4,6-dehydratase
VLDPLNGYLTLAERMWDDGPAYAGAWNFGPADEEDRPVSWVVTELVRRWGGEAKWITDQSPQPHEAGLLRLDCSKSRERLEWRPRVDLGIALDWVIEWHRRHASGESARKLTDEQIARFQDGSSR